MDRDLEVELVSIGQEENRRCVAVFRGNTYLQELTLLRRQSAEIVLDSTDGIRVPRAALRSAVREVTETDPETEDETTKQVSVTGVYCVSGAKAVFKPVEVLYTRRGLRGGANHGGRRGREAEAPSGGRGHCGGPGPV